MLVLVLVLALEFAFALETQEFLAARWPSELGRCGLGGACWPTVRPAKAQAAGWTRTLVRKCATGATAAAATSAGNPAGLPGLAPPAGAAAADRSATSGAPLSLPGSVILDRAHG